ncbi:MAG TPA: hypothetical protein VMC80_01920, partial [Patescibacteria group bacterium]|nr:hypothetical protein [Patescibacteria group bacterium]
MFKFTIHHDIEGEFVFNTPPEGWKNGQISYSRSESLFGLVRKYSYTLGFAQESKAFIKNIILTYGINTEIYIDIEKYDRRTLNYIPFLENGLLLLDTYQEDENFIHCSIQDSSFDAKIDARLSNDIAYQSDETIEGSIIPKVEDTEFATITINGIATATQAEAIYPFRLFERIVNIITDCPDRFRSQFLGRIGDIGSSFEGEGSRRMITKGSYIRAYDLGVDQLSISLETLFKSFSAIFNLGMGVEKLSNGQRVLRIDKMKYFFQPVVVVTFDNISELTYEVNKDFIFNKITAGYGIEVKKDSDDIAGMEYNTKATYSTPIKYLDKELSIVSDVRADGTGIE